MTDFEEAIESVVWYNDLASVVAAWAELPELNSQSLHPAKLIPMPDNYLADGDYARQDYWQLQILWMICVELFGDCGSSPRTGWITKTDEFREFCRTVTRRPLEWAAQI